MDILKERTFLTGRVDGFRDLQKDLEDSALLLEMALEESDVQTIEEVRQQMQCS